MSSWLTYPVSYKIPRCTGWVCVTSAEKHQASALDEEAELIITD